MFGADDENDFARVSENAGFDESEKPVGEIRRQVSLEPQAASACLLTKDPGLRDALGLGYLEPVVRTGIGSSFVTHPSPSFAASPIRCSLPVAPFGISSMNRIFAGTLNLARWMPA